MLSLPEAARSSFAPAIARLDEWFQTMRGPGGYSGPISHWWESSLLYCGAMADWRYEGIICGYLELFRQSRRAEWLDRARQAGDDLIAAQLPSGKFRNSAFQQGPIEGGTPHEAAVDVGLLELALVLREIGDGAWRGYFETAERNIQSYLIGELWNGEAFRDQPWNRTLVSNKNATALEALILYEVLSGRDMSEYLEGAAAVIFAAQEQSGPRAGATVHVGTGHHKLAIGIYTARSTCALLRLYRRYPNGKILDFARDALSFLRGLSTVRGSYFGRYRDGTLIANPRIIAGSGDILRAMVLAREHGLATDGDVDGLAEVLVQSQLPSGGIPTGYGFARRGDWREHDGLPEFRDVLPVVGWCDKAFRALVLASPSAGTGSLDSPVGDVHMECTWKERPCIFSESGTEMRLHDARTGVAIYRWEKGTCYPSVYYL